MTNRIFNDQPRQLTQKDLKKLTKLLTIQNLATDTPDEDTEQCRIMPDIASLIDSLEDPDPEEWRLAVDRATQIADQIRNAPQEPDPNFTMTTEPWSPKEFDDEYDDDFNDDFIPVNN